MNCEYYKEGMCSACPLIGRRAGIEMPDLIPVSEKHCNKCLSSENPKEENDAMIAAVNIYLHRNDKESYPVFRKYRQSRKIENFKKDHGENNVEYVKTPPREELLGEGVGTELYKLIPKTLAHKGCKCKDYAAKMNRLGADECEKRIDIIVDHLVRKSTENPLLGWVPSFATEKVARQLVRKAISNFRKKQGQIDIISKPKFNWFVAVTTAPRTDNKIKECLDSLAIAGFDPFIFAEPESQIVGDYDRVIHKQKKGVWHNFLYSVRYALENTNADTIMTVQDDSLFHPDSKDFAESILWPHEDTGFVSLYTPKQYSLRPRMKTAQRDVGVNRIHTRSLWGACALIWPRSVLEQFIEHPTALNWIGAPTKTRNSRVMQKRRENPDIVANSDTAIGKIMNNLQKHMYFVDPSPVKHIAEHSTISHGGNQGRRNCSRCATWKDSLFNQVPINFDPVDINNNVSH